MTRVPAAQRDGSKMPYRAIIFDLFGTLVGNFSRSENDKVIAQLAEILNLPYPKFWQRMGETYVDRCLGRYAGLAEFAQSLCAELGIKVETAQLSNATQLYDAFIANALMPEPAVLTALDTLKNDGITLGLISDCVPAVQRLFPKSPLAKRIDTAVFSCQERMMKPARGIYQRACRRLHVQPAECLYVGDGSSQELTGAATAGMVPILKRTELSDVYDARRPDVENWQGPVIDEIREVFDFVSGAFVNGERQIP